MADDRQPFEELFDLLVFAPIGLATMVHEHLPDLVGKGRQRWASQSAMARVVGEFAVAQGRRETAKAAQRAGSLFGQVIGQRQATSRPSPAADAPATDAPSPAPPAAPPPSEPPRPANAADARGGGAGTLAIPGYDALSAPQVVSRLDGLSGDELEAVRAYEQRTRGRKTILGRVAQLQALLD